MDLAPRDKIGEAGTAPEHAPKAKLIRMQSLPSHGQEEPQAILVKPCIGEPSDHGIPGGDIPRGHFVKQLPSASKVAVLDVTPNQNVPGHDVRLRNSLEQAARSGEVAEVRVGEHEVVGGEAVGGGARGGGKGVELAEERDGAAGPADVGEEGRVRPEDVPEGVVEGILEAAA
uniref:Uncharacterized protein n=1 Tax=Triticum urartu TaxID=4572 RepID=A0A8R7RE00_TRIUA